MNIFDIPQDFLRNPLPEALRLPTRPVTFPQASEWVISGQLRAHYEPGQQAMWSHWNPAPRPCFNAGLLADIRHYHDFLAATRGQLELNGATHAIDYVVLASDKPGVFNLGGDLDLFKKMIAEQNHAELLRYSPPLAGAVAAVEPAPHVLVGNAATGPAHSKSTNAGTHGFWPTRPDYHSVFLLSGPGIKPGKLGTIEMVSLMGRFAKVLGLKCGTP